MASKDMRAAVLALVVVVLMQCVGADIEKDRQQCVNELAVLYPCLFYVQGEAKSPTLDCCTGLKQVLQNSKVCLCILIKDHDDPDLGIKINATLALGLPSRCNAPSDVNQCPSLLHLAPGSPDAKIFEDFSKNDKGGISGKQNGTSEGSSTSTSTSTSSAAIKSDGGMGRKWLGIEMCFGLALFVFLLISPFTV